ncbi:hypothetical protein ABZV64_09875 [Streptomyces sp. NPDC004959]|uniref:hypothetical protein n=1 Tax=unclassified Streptomyces TaxID=2593676 RepID=UPI0004C5857D|nr:hypothetical protein [Streptomyces sp. NRRL F-5630]
MRGRHEDTRDRGIATRIGQAALLLHAGDRAEARARLLALWEELPPGPGPHRCALAHYLAEAQDDPARRLDWDLTALRAAGPGNRSLLPRLRLALAADYARAGRTSEARAHLVRAREAAESLTAGPYTDGVRAAIIRLGQRLGV